jgi:cytochrome P450
MRLLMEHPEERRKLVENPSLIPNAVEEFLRYNPAVMYFRRTLTDDFELRGKKMKKGDKVVMWYPSANRDEDVFADPDRFDVTRNIPEHLGLGIGEHYCLGASFARCQLRSIFTEVLTRIPDMELVAPIRFLRSNFIDGVKEMPVRFTPAARTSSEAAAAAGCPFHQAVQAQEKAATEPLTA